MALDFDEGIAAQQIERAGGFANNGLARLADTKLSLKEILKSKYDREFIERYLKDMAQFDLYNNALRIQIAGVRREIRQEINELNDVINALQRCDDDHDDLIEQLRDAKKDLKSAKSAVEDADRQRGRARNIDDLEDIAREVEQQTQAANQASQEWRNQNRNHDHPHNNRQNHWGGPELDMGMRGNDDGDQPNSRIKVELTRLAGKRNAEMVSGLTTLHDYYGYRPVAREISGLYHETRNDRYVQMETALNAIAARRDNDDTPGL